MHLIFAIPGLAWPAASLHEALRDLALPALSRLLGLARTTPLPGHTLESWLPGACGLEGNAVPYAALRLLGEGLDPAGHPWLCADPTCLHFHQELLTLVDGQELAISATEAAELVAGLNREFADLGEFIAPTPTRWYLRLATPPALQTRPLADVQGRKLDAFLPQGADARRWRGYANEIQTWLHCHPVNQARDDNGQPRINNLWFWGEGPSGVTPRPPARHVGADAPLARGLARAGGSTTTPLPSGLGEVPAGEGSSLLVLDDLRLPGLALQIQPWQAALRDLERKWFAPALEQMKKGHIKRLQVVALGDQASIEATLEAGELRKFWRRPAPLHVVLKP